VARASRINLSAWALEHQPLLRYLMVVLLIGGAFAFTALGQDEKKWPRGRDAKQALAQFEERLEIGGGPDADRDQTILVELGRLNKQGALRGRVVGRGDADAFGDAQTASIEEMIQNVTGAKPEGS